MSAGRVKFRSNNCVAIHLKDLNKAERFYSNVMGFRLLKKSAKLLEYDTGHFVLYIDKGSRSHPPIPSFTVANIARATTHLRKNKCRIVIDWGKALYFRDPFGIVYDIIEG
jgi:catechol 2,3-dioxygenase-like lactoylglutathione lyase family enzyme